MEVSTGHLVRDINAVPEELRPRYTQVPDYLNRAARKKLGRKSEATVSLTSGGALSTWARKEQKRKAKRKSAAASRRKNR